MDGVVEDKIDCIDLIDIGNHREEEPGSYASNGSYASYVSPMVADVNFSNFHFHWPPSDSIGPIT